MNISNYYFGCAYLNPLLGHIAVAISKEHFGRYFEAGMRSALQGVQLGDEALKEHSYVFIANCAKVQLIHTHQLSNSIKF